MDTPSGHRTCSQKLEQFLSPGESRSTGSHGKIHQVAAAKTDEPSSRSSYSYQTLVVSGGCLIFGFPLSAPRLCCESLSGGLFL